LNKSRNPVSILIFLTGLAISACSPSTEASDNSSVDVYDGIIGAWARMDDRSNIERFEFYPDGAVLYQRGSKEIYGPSSESSATWSINKSYDPMHLDIMVINKADSFSEQTSTWKIRAIVEKHGSDKIRLTRGVVGNDGQIRPTSFGPDSDSIFTKMPYTVQYGSANTSSDVNYESGPIQEVNLNNFIEVSTVKIDKFIPGFQAKPIHPLKTKGGICSTIKNAEHDIYLRIVYFKDPSIERTSKMQPVDYMIKIPSSSSNEMNCDDESYVAIPNSGSALVQKQRPQAYSLKVSEEFFAKNPKIQSKYYLDPDTGKLNTNLRYHDFFVVTGLYFLK